MGHAIMSHMRMISPFRLRNDLHLARKIWHISSGLLGLAAYQKLGLSQEQGAIVLLSFALLAFVVEFIRLKSETINYYVMILMKPFMRESEKTSISGMPFYALGVSLTLFFFPEKIAILASLFLIFADPIASFFGILYGKDKILPNKSLQGTLAAFSVCYIITLIYGLIYANPSMDLLVFSIVGGIVGALSEMCSQFIDDNLCIPVVSGLGLFLMNSFLVHLF